MKKIIIRYGAISALLISGLMAISTALSSQIGFDNSEIVGYASLVISFLVIFFAVRAYYKNNPEVKVAFLKSLSIGLLITLISSVAYVIVWLILYYTVFPDFWDKYGAHLVEKLHKSGVAQSEIDKQVNTLKSYRELYKNPLYNAAFTFMEPLPVGILISLISAAVIRRSKAS